MARSRHAMRVHPLRSKGVVVGVPVAAVVAFGAHSVLGVTPLSEQQDAPAPTPAAAPSAAAPLQSYGLATPPPPTSLDLLSAPGEQASTSGSAASTGSTGSGGSTATSPERTTTRISGHRAPAGPTETLPIAAAPAARAAAPAPSMMTFSGGGEQARPAAASAPAQEAPQQQAAQQQQQEAPQQAEESDGGSQQSSGGSVLGVDLGVAKVSVLSFGS